MRSALFHVPALVVVAAFCARRLLRYLRYFQQEEYSAGRYVAWIWKHKAFDRRGTATALGCGLAVLAAPRLHAAAESLFVVLIAAWTVLEPNPLRSGKLPLRLTSRAGRILAVSGLWLIAALATLAVWILRAHPAPGVALQWSAMAALIQAVPYALILGNAILLPEELMRQRRYIREAKEQLARCKPFVIAVTGSYGKTSTKLMVAELMRQAGATFCPPGSTNTTMGISRAIRTNLRPDDRYAVLEYGAYKIGSISKLCELARPDAAIITAVGIMHLERFGSEEAILRAKSELAAATPPGSLLVLNGDDPKCRSIAEEYSDRRVVLYGLSDSSDLHYRLKVTSTDSGSTEFTIEYGGGKSVSARAQVMGRHLLSNMLAAFALSAELGVPVPVLVAALPNIRPPSNRLEVAKDGPVTILRDAYNSNPVGFREALAVLASFRTGRKILLTPGMVELGPRQSIENCLVAKEAARICDHVIVVGDTNRSALMKGFGSSAERHGNIEAVDTRDEALRRLGQVAQPGDTVLIENDLPDLYDDCKGL